MINIQLNRAEPLKVSYMAYNLYGINMINHNKYNLFKKFSLWFFSYILNKHLTKTKKKKNVKILREQKYEICFWSVNDRNLRKIT